jgi:hypothetical protein
MECGREWLVWIALDGWLRPRRREARGDRAAPATRPVPARHALERRRGHDAHAALADDQPFRTDLTITGLVDSVAGFELHMRLEPTTNKGTAWKFANSGTCLAAVWAGTVGDDPQARALAASARHYRRARWMMERLPYRVRDLRLRTAESGLHVFALPHGLSATAGGFGRCALRRLGRTGSDLCGERHSPVHSEPQQPVLDIGKAIYFEPIAK